MTIREQVQEFHRTYDVPIAKTPTVPSRDRLKLRIALIVEEYAELLEACGVHHEIDRKLIRCAGDLAVTSVDEKGADIVAIADALADLTYVIEGMNIELGINSESILAEVHRSNMSKLGNDGQPMRREDGKVLKGPNYSPPDIAGELRKQGWRS